MLKLTVPRVSASGLAALLISSATWADMDVASSNETRVAPATGNNSLAMMLALEVNKPPGGGAPGGGHPGGGNPGGGHPGGGNPGGGHPGGGHSVVIKHPPHTIPNTKPSHFSNPHTVGNLNKAKQNIGSIHHSTNVTNYIQGKNTGFASKYNVNLQAKYNVYRPYYGNNAFRFYYSGWYSHGFSGGYYYPIRPWWGIHEYFYYPTIYWLYNDLGEGDIPYYQAVYGSEYASCPVQTFEYARVYFPTDTMRDLGVEMSALQPARQCNFRAAMLTMTRSLRQQISDLIAANFTFGEYSVIVNHYENLQNQALVVEGFVDQGTIHVAFKGFLDLVNPSQTTVFIPKSQDPTASELNVLDDLNARIRKLGGNPDQVNLEPETGVNP